MPQIHLKPRSLGLSRLSTEQMTSRERELLDKRFRQVAEYMLDEKNSILRRLGAVPAAKLTIRRA